MSTEIPRPDAVIWSFWDAVVVIEEQAERMKPIRMEVTHETH